MRPLLTKLCANHRNRGAIGKTAESSQVGETNLREEESKAPPSRCHVKQTHFPEIRSPEVEDEDIGFRGMAAQYLTAVGVYLTSLKGKNCFIFSRKNCNVFHFSYEFSLYVFVCREITPITVCFCIKESIISAIYSVFYPTTMVVFVNFQMYPPTSKLILHIIQINT